MRCVYAELERQVDLDHARALDESDEELEAAPSVDEAKKRAPLGVQWHMLGQVACSLAVGYYPIEP